MNPVRDFIKTSRLFLYLIQQVLSMSIPDESVIRFYCGYVEPLCDRFKGFSIQALLDQLDQSITIDHTYFARDLKQYPHITLCSAKHVSPLLYAYAISRNLLNYEIISDTDKDYIDKCINRYTLSAILYCDYAFYSRPYPIPIYALTTSAINRNYRVINMSEAPPIKVDAYPIHRDPCIISGGERVERLGCYVQLCEKRLEQQGYLDNFIKRIYYPLLKSKIDHIVICIDPLPMTSNNVRLTDIARRLIEMDPRRLYSIEESDVHVYSSSRVHVIVPASHVHASVGRNLMFHYIRNVLPLANALWFGADDDDRINKIAAINQLRDIVRSDKIRISHIVLFDEKYATKDVIDPDTGYMRYSPWSYAFSPVYYNGISFPCAPIEKEDLDVFNRFMQHPERVKNIAAEMYVDSKSIDVYEYSGSNPDRPKPHALYETGDMIDYLNEHNIVESVDTPLIAPSMSAQVAINEKTYYPNTAECYYYHEDNDDIRIPVKQRQRKGETEPRPPIMKRNAFYGMSVKGKGSTQKDTRMGDARKQLKDVLDGVNNFNGDCYIMTYVSFNGQHEQLYGASFQNGKSPDIIPLTVPTKHRIEPYNTSPISQELDSISPGLASILTVIKEPFDGSDHELIKRWNSYYISHYRTDKRHIPLRTFGGRSINHWLWIILSIISAMAIIFIICPLLFAVIRTHPWRKDV